ncbi:MAG: trigger factor [Candidatus Kapabacteria bacterium]|nr:trigger factor [Candidatus Kapabacteria bacterium]
MERTLSTVEACTREVRIELSEADLKPHFERAYVNAQAGITLPGFRKGKVPIPIIKQRFARDIENEALDTIADTEFRKFATDEKQRVVGNPALTDIQKSPSGVTFTIRFDVMPDFDLGTYRGLVVDRHIKTVTEEDVQREVDRICLRAATFEPAEQILNTMYVASISLHELDRETSMPIIGAEAREERVFLDDDNVDMHLRSSLANTKVGDTFSYVSETENEDQQPSNSRVTVTDIQRVVPAEFTNEFVETITGARFKTTEELRGDIERQLNEYFEQASRESLENQIVDQLVKAHEFEVPEPLVHAVIHQLFDDFKKRNEGAPGIENVTAHDVEGNFRPSAERIVRWELIRDKIITAESIAANDEDIAAAAGRYGLQEEQLRMIMRQNHTVEDQILAEKAVRTIIDYAIINDVIVDSEQPVI